MCPSFDSAKDQIPVERWWNLLQKDDKKPKISKMILAGVGTRAFMHLPLHGKWIWLPPKRRASMPFEISGDSWDTFAKRDCHPTPRCEMWFSLKWRIIASAFSLSLSLSRTINLNCECLAAWISHGWTVANSNPTWQSWIWICIMIEYDAMMLFQR